MSDINYWDALLDRPLLFTHKDALRHTFLPANLLHRDKELKAIMSTEIDILKGNTPDNIYIFGKSGTGKSVCVRRVIADLCTMASNRSLERTIVPVWVLGMVASETGAYQAIGEGLNARLGLKVPYRKQLGADQLTSRIVQTTKQKDIHLLIVFDEVDRLVARAGDEVLNWVSRLAADYDIGNSTVSFIGISNDASFMQGISPKLKSAQSMSLLTFSPYDAMQLSDILQARVEISVRPDVVVQEAISFAAALAAREHGDARRALDLMRKAVEIAEQRKSTAVDVATVKEAFTAVEADAVKDALCGLTEHQKLVMWAIHSHLSYASRETTRVTTGEVYSLYAMICRKIQLQPLTQRRVKDLLDEIAMMGLLDTHVVSFGGRAGRTTRIGVTIGLCDIMAAYKDETFASVRVEPAKQTSLM